VRYGKKRLTHPTPLITDIFISTMAPQSGMEHSAENRPRSRLLDQSKISNFSLAKLGADDHLKYLSDLSFWG
jgi:hypothetical protein